jgi:hypothetical protein
MFFQRLLHGSKQFGRFLLSVPKISSSLEIVAVREISSHSARSSCSLRVIGSIRRECLDHLIIIGEDHLRRTLRGYFDYYHNSRSHQALERNSPFPRQIEGPAKGKVISIPQVGGLHHRYRRAA